MSPFFALASIFAAHAGAETLTLDDALSFADQNAFAILLQRVAVERQRQVVNQTAGTLGPILSAGGVYTRNGNPSSVNFNGQNVTITPLQTGVATATVSLPIDISGNTHR